MNRDDFCVYTWPKFSRHAQEYMEDKTELKFCSPPVPPQPPVQHGLRLRDSPAYTSKLIPIPVIKQKLPTNFPWDQSPTAEKLPSPPEAPGASVGTRKFCLGGKFFFFFPLERLKAPGEEQSSGTCCHLTCGSAARWQHKSYWHVWIPKWFRLCFLRECLQP